VHVLITVAVSVRYLSCFVVLSCMFLRLIVRACVRMLTHVHVFVEVLE
jgi:hypothetical protein